MLYGILDDLVFKGDLKKYSEYTPYFEIYLKLIIKCIEKQ